MQKLVEKLGLSEGAASAVLWIGLSVLLLVVVGLLALWLVRTLRPSLNINGAGRGGRPQRLAITDAFPLDRDGRKLVIVRRDNTEHLLLIGGPNDVLIEGNITRHDRSARGLGRGGDAEGEEGTAIPAPVQAPMAAPQAPAPQAPAPQMSAPVRNDDFERALTNHRPPMAPQLMAARVTPPVITPPVITPPVITPVFTAPPAPAPVAVAPVVVAPVVVAEPAKEPPPAPTVLTLEALLPEAVAVVDPAPAVPPVEQPAPPVPAPSPRAPAMSEMARRLNEALQKPMSGTLRPPFNRSIPPAPPTASAPPAPPAPAVSQPAPEPRVAAPEPEHVAKADMDLLEEEMARLLGRPAQPKKPDAS